MAHKRSEKAAAQGKAIELALKNLRAGKYTSVNSAAKAQCGRDNIADSVEGREFAGAGQ